MDLNRFSAGIVIFACGLFAGFFLGLRFGRWNTWTTFDGEGAMNLFTPRAQQALMLARKEADRLNHTFVGTEHVLLSLISFEGVALNVLKELGVNSETVRIEVEKSIGEGPGHKMSGDILFTPRVKTVLSLAAKESRGLNHTYVGTEHILLGLLREGDGVAARVLKNLGVDVERAREEVLRQLDPNFEG
jgi:ATP-dependent Clp protease ATP-binding subunit ClpC